MGQNAGLPLLRGAKWNFRMRVEVLLLRLGVYVACITCFVCCGICPRLQSHMLSLGPFPLPLLHPFA